jgi:hypothetical protein
VPVLAGNVDPFRIRVHYLVAARAHTFDATEVEIDGSLPFAPFIAAQHVLFAPGAHTADLHNLAAFFLLFFVLHTFQACSDQDWHDRPYEKPHGRGIHSRVCIGTVMSCLANGVANDRGDRSRDSGLSSSLPTAGSRSIAVSLHEALRRVGPERCDYFVVECPVVGQVTHFNVHFVGRCNLEAEHEERGHAANEHRLRGRRCEVAAGKLVDALRIGAEEGVRAQDTCNTDGIEDAVPTHTWGEPRRTHRQVLETRDEDKCKHLLPEVS